MKKGDVMKDDRTENISFEEALQKLEAIVVALESGQTKLDDAVEAYEKATKLKQICEQKLKSAELKIEKIEQQANGELQVAPLDGTIDHE